jgi:hypothetical protein
MDDPSSEDSEEDPENEGQEDEREEVKEGPAAKNATSGVATIDDIPEKEGKVREHHKLLLR